MNNIIIKKICFLLSLLLFVNGFVVKAQTFRVLHFTKDDGLQNELVKSIAIDTLGEIWLATDEGLIRYNGIQFKQYKDSLPSIYIKSIFSSKKGKLFTATDLGVVEITSSLRNIKFKVLKPGYSKEADTSLWFPKHFYEDTHHTVWFSDNNAIWKFNETGFKKYPQPVGNLTMSWQRSFSFVEDGYGNLYAFSHPGNLFVYRKEKDFFEPVPLNQTLGFISHCIQFSDGRIIVATATGVYEIVVSPTATVLSIKPIVSNVDASFLEKRNDTEIWLGTWLDGLYLLKNMNNTPESFKIEGYNSSIVSYLSQDKKGNLWVASDNGIYLVQQNYSESLYQDISKSYTQSIYQKSEKELYFTDGDYIYLVNPQHPSQKPKTILSKTGKYFLSLTSVDNQLWAGDASGTISIIENGTIIKVLNQSKYGGAIFNMVTDRFNQVWYCQDGVKGTIRIDKNYNTKTYNQANGLSSNALILALSPGKKLYAGCANNGNFLFVYNDESDKFENLSKDFDHTQPREINIYQIGFKGDTVWLATSFGLIKYINKAFARVEIEGVLPHDAAKAVAIDKSGNVWFANSIGIIKTTHSEKFIFDETCGMPSKTLSFRGIIVDTFNQIWVGTTSGLAFFANNTIAEETPKPYFLYIKCNDSDIATGENRFLNNSLLKFRFVSSSFPAKYVQYQWRLKGKYNEWQKLESLDGLFLSNLPTGNYELEVRSRQNGHFYWSDPLIFTFKTFTAWYKTWWAFLLYFCILTIIVLIIIKIYTKRLIKRQQILENIVKERTLEVMIQKKEIEEKNEELNQTNEELKTTLDNINELNNTLNCTNEELSTTLETVNVQKNEIEVAHQNIKSSIAYAKRIQTAVLPNQNLITEILPQNFVIFRPRDIVSGDFYFIRKINTQIIISVADCTGHGVPGAFMSMLGIAFINEIIRKTEFIIPSKLINELRLYIKTSLNQTGQRSEQQDGMDIAFCVIDTRTLLMTYAGANLPCLVLRKPQHENAGEITILEPDHMPVGIYAKEKPFTDKNKQLIAGDMLYLYSDGYQSQFGGPKNEKYKAGKFRELLHSIYLSELMEQKEILEKEFDNWNLNNEQTDDVLVIGVRI